jgi:C1A family cysteine protease
MKYLALALFIAAAVAISIEEARPQFAEFVAKYHKSYKGVEYENRLKIFVENLEIAEQRNKQDTARHGVTMFSDLTQKEFAATHLMAPQPAAALAVACLRKGVYAVHHNYSAHPASWDWRNTAGVVSAVYDQGQCGSCWAFSTIQNLEGIRGVANQAVPQLSAQYVVDCSKGCSSEMYNGANTTVCNGGCNGGWPWTAFNDIATNAIGGVPDAASYPYRAVTQTCKGNGAGTTIVKISGYNCIGLDQTNNEDEMADALYTDGPLSIALNADYFNSYTGGIMNPVYCPTAYLDHAVLLVGYGTENGQDYWIVKNSWGAAWGESGYCRMARGKGCCGINEAVSCAYL